MLISNLREKLLLFKFRYGVNQKEICREIGISEQHFNRIMSGEYDFSLKMEKRIEQMFQHYQFTEALDDNQRL